jgi:uncharacterized protein YndB with AHSA1/START domain
MTPESETPGPSPRKTRMERTFTAPIEDVWELWTTVEGLESWWGPVGFSTRVLKLELRPGGELVYAMTATGPQEIEFMKRAGMPLTTEGRVTYTQISAPRLLSYTHKADFIPGVEPYDVATVVELHAVGKDVRMVLTFDAMHDDQWTQRATMGWESQLGKLAEVVAKRR